MTRRLTRKSKDLACMRQFGLCGYCESTLTDSAQVDHMNENRTDDAEDNLIAACCNCHGDKTQHYRKKRNAELQAMLARGKHNKARWREIWAEDDDHWAKLPEWLQERICQQKARFYSIRCRPRSAVALSLECYRYQGPLRQRRPLQRPLLDKI